VQTPSASVFAIYNPTARRFVAPSGYVVGSGCGGGWGIAMPATRTAPACRRDDGAGGPRSVRDPWVEDGSRLAAWPVTLEAAEAAKESLLARSGSSWLVDAEVVPDPEDASGSGRSHVVLAHVREASDRERLPARVDEVPVNVQVQPASASLVSHVGSPLGHVGQRGAEGRVGRASVSGLPEGRVLALSLSGTDRRDWKVMLAAVIGIAFGGGYMLGRASSVPEREQAASSEERRRRMRELAGQ